MSKNGNVVSLAERMDDSTMWTASDALRDALAEIESGKINPKGLAIHFYEETADGSLVAHWCAADLTYEKHLALLEIAKHRVIDDWKT